MLIPLTEDSANKREETESNWLRYLKHVRLMASIRVFIIKDDPSSLNQAVKKYTEGDRTQMVIMSMRPNVKKFDLSDEENIFNWIENIRLRVEGIQNVLLVWSMSPSSIVD